MNCKIMNTKEISLRSYPEMTAKIQFSKQKKTQEETESGGRMKEKERHAYTHTTDLNSMATLF